MGLTKKQELFVAEYLIDKNATRAAKAVGYSERTAGKIGSENLSKPEIAKAIEEGLKAQMRASEARAAKTGLTKERWLLELRRVAFANMDDFAVVSGEGSNVKITATADRKKGRGAAIKKLTETQTQHGGTTAIELHNKIPALEILGKAYGWVKDQVEMSGPGGGPQVIVTLPGNGFEFESQPENKDIKKDE